MRILTLSLCAVAALAAVSPAQSSITTSFNGAISFGLGSANLFDLQLNTGISISQVDVNVGEPAGTTGSFDIYTTPGTYVGNELNSAVWTLVGSASVTAAGLRSPSPGVLSTPVALTPGSYGVAVCYNGLTPNYLGASSPTTYSNADMTLTLGAAVNGCFTGSVLNNCVWNGTIHYQPGSNLATWGRYGTGCGAGGVPGFYELFDAVNPIDLANLDFTMNAAGLSYVVTPGTGAWFTPTSPPLGTGDDHTQQITLPFPFPYQGGITNDIWVCSNGWIALESTTDTSYSGSLRELLAGPTRICALWTDLNPGTGGAGTLHFDVDPSGGAAYVTWLGVPQWGSTSTCDFQVKFDQFANIELRYQTLAVFGALVGFSPGHAAPDPGPVDISAITALQLGDGRAPLTLGNQAGSRPVIGTTFNLEVSSIPPGTSLGAIVYSFTQINPGTDLSGIGMPGCSQFLDLDATFLLLPTGTTHSIPFVIPNLPGLAGSHVYAQAAMFSSGFNPLGVITSNGGDMQFDVN